MITITKTKPVDIVYSQDNSTPPNKKPPFNPPSMSPNTYYLEMLDILYKNFTLQEYEKK